MWLSNRSALWAPGAHCVSAHSRASPWWQGIPGAKLGSRWVFQQPLRADSSGCPSPRTTSTSGRLPLFLALILSPQCHKVILRLPSIPHWPSHSRCSHKSPRSLSPGPLTFFGKTHYTPSPTHTTQTCSYCRDRACFDSFGKHEVKNKMIPTHVHACRWVYSVTCCNYSWSLKPRRPAGVSLCTNSLFETQQCSNHHDFILNPTRKLKLDWI